MADGSRAPSSFRATAPAARTDIDAARLVFEQLAPQLGQPVVVENRPGAGGTVGTGFVANAKPDGYTLLVNSTAHTIAPALYQKLSYDPERDFAAVIPLGISPNVLVVSPAKGFKTVGDLVAAAKAAIKPEGLRRWRRSASEARRT